MMSLIWLPYNENPREPQISTTATKMVFNNVQTKREKNKNKKHEMYEDYSPHFGNQSKPPSEVGGRCLTWTCFSFAYSHLVLQ